MAKSRKRRRRAKPKTEIEPKQEGDQVSLPTGGRKMVPGWVLQVLLAAVGIVGGGAVWYFLSQKMFHVALWVGFAGFVVFGLVVALFVRNEIIKNETAPASQIRPPGGEARPPFFVEIEKAFLEPQKKFEGTRFWLAYKSGYGDTVSPISLTMFLRIVNLQKVPSEIERYVVEMKIGDTAWVKLARMDVREGEVFFAVDGLKRTRRIDVRPNGLDYLLGDKALKPHETVRGWVFYEIPDNYIILDGMSIRYSITVRDTAGVQFSYTPPEETASSKLAPPGTNDAAQSQPWYVREWRDLSSFHQKYFSEPIP
jgi:hypothetical protein